MQIGYNLNFQHIENIIIARYVYENIYIIMMAVMLNL